MEQRDRHRNEAELNNLEEMDAGNRSSFRDVRPLPSHAIPADKSAAWLLGLAFIGFLLCYADRINVSVTIIPMSEAFSWSNRERGIVLSSFFWGYIVFNVCGGLLACRFSGKRVLLVAVLGWSIATLVTPAAAHISFGALLAARVLMGLFEGLAFPAIVHVFSSQIPESARARAMGITMAGSSAGAVVAFAITPELMEPDLLSWEGVFFLFGTAGIAWCLAWHLKAPDDTSKTPSEIEFMPGEPPIHPGPRSPSPHPVAEDTTEAPEAALLGESSSNYHLKASGRFDAGGSKGPTAWAVVQRLAASPAVWAIAASHFAHNWAIYTILTWLPSYFHLALHIPAKAVYVSFVPYLFKAVTEVAVGRAVDALASQPGASLTNIRKAATMSGFAAMAVMLVCFPFVSSPAAATVIITLGCCAAAVAHSGFGVNHLDIAGEWSGTLFGFTNTIATLPGIVGVAAVPFLLELSGGNWLSVWGTAAAILVLAGAFYVRFATSVRSFP